MGEGAAWAIRVLTEDSLAGLLRVGRTVVASVMSTKGSWSLSVSLGRDQDIRIAGYDAKLESHK